MVGGRWPYSCCFVGCCTPQNSSYTATYHLSRKLSKLDEPELWDIAEEVWTPSHGRAKARWPARTYIQHLCADTGYNLEDLSGEMDDRDEWRDVMFWPSIRPKNAIPRWCTGRKWHIPMASNRKRSRGRIKAYNMGQGEGPTVPLQSDAPEESDLWTTWQLFPLDDD